MFRRVILVWRTLLGHYRLHPTQALFLLVGLSLGVAILLATLVVGKAAKSTFSTANQSVMGTIPASIVPSNGRSTLPESFYIQLRRLGFTDLVPQVTGRQRLENDQSVTILGVDMFATMHRSNTQSVNAAVTGLNAKLDPQTLLRFSFPPYQPMVSQTLAKLKQWHQGDVLTLSNGQALAPIQVISDDFGSGYQLLCDLRCAQQLLDYQGQLSAIWVTALPTDLARLKGLLPANTALKFATKNTSSQGLTDAFFLNIHAVSMLAFLVGCFIAFNAVRFSVIQRFAIVQQLRMTGVTASEVAVALLFELLLWAFLASLIGSLLGYLLASTLLPNVGLTLLQLFQSDSVLSMPNIGQWWFYGVIIALVATVFAVAQPFYRLARQQPLQKQIQSASQSSRHLVWLGGASIVSGWLLTLLPPSQTLGFAVAACWFMGGALLIPGLLAGFYHWLGLSKKWQKYPKLQWLIADGRFNHARLSVAMMAFTVAVAAGIAISTLVSSFQLALEDHLDQVLAEDLYLQPDVVDAGAIHQYLTQHQGVKLAYRFLHTTAKIQHQGIQYVGWIRGITDHPLRHHSINLEKQTTDIWSKLHRREGVVINQTLAFEQRIRVGDSVSLQAGERSLVLPVLGVYYSYGSTVSALLIDQQWLTTLWPELQTPEVGVFLDDGTNPEQLINTLTTRFQLNSQQILKPQSIKAMAMNIFAQTFAATRLLTVITLIIAAIGIYCACFAAQQDQQRQLVLLKMLGIDQWSLTLLSLLQLLINAVIAAMVALPLGLAVAWASVHIVLQYSFGWHFAVVPDYATLLTIIAGALAVAVCSGFMPLYLMSRKVDITALREAA